jgi:glycosyltransferase involved in cell wall biosynthesis
MHPMKVVSYATIPQANGEFSFYQNLRSGINIYGWEVKSIVSGLHEHMKLDTRFWDDGCISISPQETDQDTLITRFIDWCLISETEIVIPMTSQIALGSLKDLFPLKKIVYRCAYIDEDKYELILQNIDYISSIVAITPRHLSDLIGKYKVPRNKVVFIPNGIDTAHFAPSVNRKQFEGRELHLAVLGRLEFQHKGIFLIPHMLHHLESLKVDYQLSIAGCGEDEGTLRNQLEDYVAGGKVRFLGSLSREDVPGFLRKNDIFLFPSTSEGFGFSLVEAMSVGCVPIAAKIDGVTDFIIQDGRNGFLCDPNDAKLFAQRIADLYNDRRALRTLSTVASRSTRVRFSIHRMALNYHYLFNKIVS